MKNKLFSIVAIAAIVLAASACSKKTSTAGSSTPPPPSNEQKKPSGGPSFDALLAKMDTNKDGKLSLSEAQGPLKDDFSYIDTNKDGFLTKEEFSNAPTMQGRK